jgi:beta-xylosidase
MPETRTDALYRKASNPFLPEGVYIPDGEAHAFGNRVYLLGSQDRFGGPLYCMEDYEVWSAPVDDLGAWTNHGIAYRRDQDPYNDGQQPDTARGSVDGLHRLYAPDFCKGILGRFYLYYCLDTVSRVGVAVADRPEGPYEFLDYVRTADGAILGERPRDLVQFDPGVLVDEGRVYLYTGNGPINRPHKAFGYRRNHSMVTELAPDMITVADGPRQLLPDVTESRGTGFEKRELFEASSIRKIGDLYYLVYSDITAHSLSYATSRSPSGPSPTGAC